MRDQPTSELAETLNAHSVQREVKMRLWHVYHVNCDCASYNHAWQREVSGFRCHRCIFCNRRLGLMELHFYASVRAISEYQAIGMAVPKYPVMNKREQPNAEVSHE